MLLGAVPRWSSLCWSTPAQRQPDPHRRIVLTPDDYVEVMYEFRKTQRMLGVTIIVSFLAIASSAIVAWSGWFGC